MGPSSELGIALYPAIFQYTGFMNSTGAFHYANADSHLLQVRFSDDTASIFISTWGQLTEVLDPGKSYSLCGPTVRVYSNVKYVNTNMVTIIC